MNRFIRQTNNGAMDYELDPGVGFQLEEVRLHLDAAGGTSEDLTITLNSNASTASGEYDVIFAKQDMENVTDYVYQPDKSHIFTKGDTLQFEYANTNNRTYGLEIIFRSISF